ncbi:DNA topoisomerase II [Aureococcus anophagefferens]|nr:DNA topoisomerase II [Aureococcus anophagefferens]
MAPRETVQRKSAAEFFTENQNIAGFDNPGKSLYTTIRELVENSLDAAESLGVPPRVELTVQELSQREIDGERGMQAMDRIDEELFAEAAGAKKKKGRKKKDDDEDEDPDRASSKKGAMLYYRVTCRDNGCGMRRAQIPDALGRVLSGSKYGVRQTRGKFGLGAKMALIWSKKSSGFPVKVRTAVAASGAGDDYDREAGPPGAAHVSQVTLDIDIQKNEPNVLEDSQAPNPERWRGLEMEVVVGGAWGAYKSRIATYLRQLAIITPYAALSLQFRAADGQGKKDVALRFERRSTKVPPCPKKTGYHPSAVNELLLQQLLRRTTQKTLVGFLARGGELSSISGPLAKRVVAECGGGFRDDDDPRALGDDAKKVSRLARLLREVKLFPPPSGDCLSPVGEYNLRLGIEKELRPEYVATCTQPCGCFNGHPFLVEVGVSLGGEGVEDNLNVHRFANRIPLLFEAGADVVTRVAKTKVKWGAYKIDLKKEKVGIFVSLVSTKIPFKGTSKECIGEDATDIHDAIKAALCQCGSQLKAQLVKRDQARQGKDRKKNLLRYVPDVAAALWKVLGPLEGGADAADAKPSGGLRRRLGACGDAAREDLGEAGLVAELRRNVDAADLDAVAASFQDASASKKRVDMRRRAAREDAVGEHRAAPLRAQHGPAAAGVRQRRPRAAPRREGARAQVAEAPGGPGRRAEEARGGAPGGEAGAGEEQKSVDWTKDLDSDSEDAAPAPKAAFSFDDSDDSDVLAFDSRSPVKPKKPAAKRKPAGSDDDSDDGVNAKLQAKKRKTEAAVDSDSDDGADAKRARRARRPGRSRKQMRADDDDDDADVEPDDDDEEEWN